MVAEIALGSLSSWTLAGDARLAQPVSIDAALARAAARGDRDAFGRRVERHKRAVYGYCCRLLGDAEEARDAAQEAFVRAYASLATFDVEQPFAPWILRIARNHCLDLLRHRLPAERTVALDAPADEGPARDLEDESAPRGDAVLERAQLTTALESAVAALPPKYREVVQLYHVQQLAYRDIAGVLGVPIGTVMTWLHRARAQLRERLAAHGGSA